MIDTDFDSDFDFDDVVHGSASLKLTTLVTYHRVASAVTIMHPQVPDPVDRRG
jgi:hypothetical protein